MKKIVLDCMGGDNAPDEIVKGALLALDNNPNLHLVLTGREEIIKKLIDRHNDRIEIINATDVISNDDSPTEAIRKKTESSMVKGFDALKNNDDILGIVSAGSTGALLTGAFLKVGRIKGISRPAMAAFLPVINNYDEKSGVVLCDCGANIDCKPQNLLHFAIMADAFYKLQTGKKECKVALLSNGTEDSKGTELNLETFELLNKTNLNFVGNMEARDILSGNYDVIVADGFNGNIALKSLEGAGLGVFKMLKDNITNGGLSAKIGALMLKPVFHKVKHALDVNEKGGAVFLGANKVVIKAHGSSKAKSICIALQQAYNLCDLDIVGAIKKSLEQNEVNQ